MQIDALLALVFRFAMIFVYGYLVSHFHDRYKYSKKTGYPNNYFLGFSALFFILALFHVLYGYYELYVKVQQNYVDLKVFFPWYVEQGNAIDSIAHQVRPAYLIFYFLMNCVIASQVYPLERFLGKDKTPFTKLILCLGSSLWLLFIPPLSYTMLSFVIIGFGFLGFFLGIMLNVGVNLKIFFTSTGSIRKQALFAVMGFLMLSIGLVWSMEVGWGSAVTGLDIGNRWDVVIGSIIQMVAAPFYLMGFSISIDEPVERSALTRIVKGDFNHKLLAYYLTFTAGIMVFFVLLAYLAYPKENAYDIMKDTFSFLGSSDADNNPDGWFLFTVSLTVTGVLLFPINLFRLKMMRQINPKGAILSFLFYSIAAIGLFLVGVFPDNGGMSFYSDVSAGTLHARVALFAFAGFGVGLLWDFFNFMRDRLPVFKGEKKYPLNLWLGPYVLFFIVVGLAAYTQIAWSIICESGCWPGDGIYSFPLWEWIVILMVFAVIYWLLLGLAKMNDSRE
jgi:hypothetical membrane protein